MLIKGEFDSNVFSKHNIVFSKSELEKSARTLIGKSVFFNGKVVGKVTDADFKDGKVVYVAEVTGEYLKQLNLTLDAKIINVHTLILTGLSII